MPSASIRHGHGAHAEYHLGYWDSRGVRSAVSAHWTTDRSSTLLERLVSLGTLAAREGGRIVSAERDSQLVERG